MLRNTKLPGEGQSEEEQDIIVDTSCCFITTENGSFHFWVTADTEQRFITADPCLKGCKESCLWRLPAEGRGGERGSHPSVCSTSGAVQMLMLKSKDVENKEREEQSCSSFQSEI